MRDMFRSAYIFGCSDVMVETTAESGRHKCTTYRERGKKKESSIHDEKWTNGVYSKTGHTLLHLCCIWINSVTHKQVYKCTRVNWTHWTWICLMFYATINVVQIEYSIRFYTCNANMMCDCMKCCSIFICVWEGQPAYMFECIIDDGSDEMTCNIVDSLDICLIFNFEKFTRKYTWKTLHICITWWCK